MITTTGLVVRFGGVTPIDDVSLTFEGGTCGLIGPNGAGKTTFLNLMSGFVRPAAGSVTVDGEDLLAMAPTRRARWGIRRTFQQEHVIDDMAIADNIRLADEHSDHRGGADAVSEALDIVGLHADPRARPRSLDARERRLLEIARAIVGKPRLVLLDEPAAGLDEAETAHLADVITAIADRGATVILVEHDMSLVGACCQTTAVLDFGRLIALGPTDDVLVDEVVQRAYLGTLDT